MIPVRRPDSVGDDWTAADFDSMLCLLESGARSHPASRVTRARRPRPIRRAVRAALRQARAGAAVLIRHGRHIPA